MSERDDNQDEPTAEERHEAAALAKALEGSSDVQDAPVDALEAAALLRMSRPTVVDDARLAPIGHRLKREMPIRFKTKIARHWIVSFSVSAVAAASLILWLQIRPSSAPAFALPPVPRSLLDAQAKAAHGGAGAQAALAALDEQMKAYRPELFARAQRRGPR